MSAEAATGIPALARLEGRFAPAARERIESFLASFRSFEPTLGLLYGDLDGRVAGGPSWSITAFGPQTVHDIVRMYASFGAVVSYEFDGIRIVVPQMAHLAKLEGAELDFRGSRLVPNPPDSA